MKIEETADKTVRGPWRFELDRSQPIGFCGEMPPPYYTGHVSISLGEGIGVLVSPEEAEMIADTLRDFAGRARQQRGAAVTTEALTMDAGGVNPISTKGPT